MRFLPLLVATFLILSTCTLASADVWVVDDQSSSFQVTGPWQMSLADSAYGGQCHTVVAVPVGAATVPSAEWTLSPDMPSGDYRIEVWLPGIAGATHAAGYYVWDLTGQHSVFLDQSASSGWTSLSEQVFSFNAASASQGVTLLAEAADADGSLVVAADAVRFVAVPEPSSLLALACGIGCVGALRRRKTR